MATLTRQQPTAEEAATQIITLREELFPSIEGVERCTFNTGNFHDGISRIFFGVPSAQRIETIYRAAQLNTASVESLAKIIETAKN